MFKLWMTEFIETMIGVEWTRFLGFERRAKAIDIKTSSTLRPVLVVPVWILSSTSPFLNRIINLVELQHTQLHLHVLMLDLLRFRVRLLHALLLHEDGEPGGELTPSGCCSRREFGRPQAAYRRK
ncbi:hypothetical protein LXL04_037344 [Taraxacum kok-saghyz]